MFSKISQKFRRSFFLRYAFSTKEGQELAVPGSHQNTSLEVQNRRARKEKITFDYLYGVNPVMSAMYINRRVMHELFVKEGFNEDNYRVQNLVSRARTLKIPIKYLDKEKLEKYARNQPHQGVILKCEPLNYYRIYEPAELEVEIEETGEKKTQGLLWVLVDQITDPQNFGAMIRAAAFLGVDGIVVNERNRCPLTPTVSKTSAGALEFTTINSLSKPDKFIKDCVSEGWRVISTAGPDTKNAKIQEISQLQLSPEENVIVLFGSESHGISPELLRNSTDVAYISSDLPPEKRKFPYTLLDSLNVSVSAGITLKMLKQKMQKL